MHVEKRGREIGEEMEMETGILFYPSFFFVLAGYVRTYYRHTYEAISSVCPSQMK